jgi:hypothetical protein
MRWATVGGLLALGTLCDAIPLPVSSALALTEGSSPWAECANEKMSADLIGRYTTLLAPPEAANVPAGTPVTFSAESGRASTPLTFRVASSPTLLSNPDIASGPGMRQAETATYTFTSTVASAVPRMVYWAASFTLNLKGCESPFTYTTPAHVLTVTAPQPPPSLPSSGVPGNTSSAPPQSKALTRAQKLANALHACKKPKSKKKRKACEAKARKLYSANKKAKA